MKTDDLNDDDDVFSEWLLVDSYWVFGDHKQHLVQRTPRFFIGEHDLS